jgi:alkylation response protein AidB-like acyl-CoA dehydrogenase
VSDFAALHDELRAAARGLLGATVGGPVEWASAAAAGWPGMEVPEDLGGTAATFAETAVVLEEVGRAGATAPVIGTAVLGVAVLAAAEAGPRRDQLTRRVAAGDARLAVVLAPNADALRPDPPFVVRDFEGQLRLDGRADFVIDATEADQLLLFATGTGDGDDLVLVAVDADAVRVDAVPVLDETRRFGSVVAADVAIDPSSVWRFAADPLGSAQALLDRASLAVACDAVGLAAAMLDATVEYASMRQQFGRPIGSFQAVKHRCADMHVQLAVARELVKLAIEAVVEGSPSAGDAVSRAASYAGEMAVTVAGDALQLHGGIGYTWESGIHRYLKRAVLDRALFGAPAAHRRRLQTTVASR